MDKWKPGSKMDRTGECDDCGLNYCHCAPDQPKAPATQRVSNEVLADLCADCRNGGSWEGHHAHLDLRDARARIAELEAERHERRVMGEIAASVVIDRCDGLERDLAFWKERAEERIGWYQEQMARADRLATELAEAKAAGREEGLTEAADMLAASAFEIAAKAGRCRSAGPACDLRMDAEKIRCEERAIRARLSPAEPTADTGEKG